MAFRAETAFRAALLAGSLPLSGATAAPGCGCQVSSCCENQFNDTFAFLGSLFSISIFPEDYRHSEYYGSTAVKHGDQESGGYLPACDLLNLVGPGVCSDPTMQDATVCEAINASADASSRMRGGGSQHSVLSAFLEPGTCEELRGDECWEQRPGSATYSWRTGRPGGCWAQGLSDATVLWDMACGGDGELRVRAQWVDGANYTEFSGCEGRNYSVETTFSADSWNGGSDSPRWQCMNIPGGDYRIFTYSIGPTPCLAEGETTPPTSGSLSVGVDLCATLVMVAVAAVGVVVAP